MQTTLSINFKVQQGQKIVGFFSFFAILANNFACYLSVKWNQYDESRNF